MNLIKFLIYAVMIFLVWRMLKGLFLKSSADSRVKGESQEKENIQEKHKRNIEDADFEEIKDDKP
jgi:large-conductance mechanosensitive channel